MTGSASETLDATKELEAINAKLARIAPTREAYAHGDYTSYSPNLLGIYRRRKAELELLLENEQLKTLLMMDVPYSKVQEITELIPSRTVLREMLNQRMSTVHQWHKTPIDVRRCDVIDVIGLPAAKTEFDNQFQFFRFFRIVLAPDAHDANNSIDRVVRNQLLPGGHAENASRPLIAWLTEQLRTELDLEHLGVSKSVWIGRIEDLKMPPAASKIQKELEKNVSQRIRHGN